LPVHTKLGDPEARIGLDAPDDVLEFRVEEAVGLKCKSRAALVPLLARFDYP
jgi:hypothetical protein